MAEVAKLHQHYGKKVKAGTLAYYDELSCQLRKSKELNFRLWPILDKRISVGAFPLGSWEQEVECDRQFFLDHYEFMDTLQHYSITTLQKGVLPPFDRIFCGNHLAVSLKSLTFACVSK